MIVIYSEKSEEQQITRLQLVDSGNGINLTAVSKDGEFVSTFATIREDGIHLWSFANDMGIKTDKNGRLKVHRDK